MFTRNPIPSATMGAKFQQHSSGRFTAEPSAPINRHHPATTSLKYTLCLQRKQSGTSALSVSAGLMSHMKLISSMWLKPDPLGERGLPCRWRRGPRSPINVVLRRLIILFTVHHPQTSHVRPAWALRTSGAQGNDHGPLPRHPQWTGGAHFETWNDAYLWAPIRKLQHLN